MTERDPDRVPDEFYVPSPEELEQGLGTPPRRRRRNRARQDSRRRESRSSWARRLFRLRPGVGERRTEAQVPAPSPPTVDDPPAAARTEPVPPRRAQPAPSSRSPSSRLSGPQKARTKPPEPVSRRPVKRGRPASSPSSGQRVRRVTVPKRKVGPPPEKPVTSPVPNYVIAKAEGLGHRLEFQEQRTGSNEHQRMFVSECESCGSKAYARNIADDNYALSPGTSTWRHQGPAFENHCSGGPER